MKKLILVIGTVVLSIFNMNATTSLKEKKNTTTISGEIAMEHIVKVYDWEVEVENGEFSGTSLNQDDAQRMLRILTEGEVIKYQKITSYYVLRNEFQTKSNRNFYWEVKSKNAYAEGFASSENNAYKMIELVATGEIITYKIIKSKK